ncbi:hypothetical protein GCM10017621_30430 [Maricaulis virginensis]|jgi:hypothetical protein|uniref:Type IV conjugative transfer system lipoprotein TraV n=2 Tax=Alphaproteobacteria TaxID=28211 RepID=A0A9W6IQU1_9PROT|nr:hypothetical protein GCM10017621_30430 [Maricaulis virginensis]
MIGRVILAVAALTLTGGCSFLPGQSSVSGDWSCRAIGQSTCHSIHENDVYQGRMDRQARITSGTHLSAGGIGADRPTFYGRHVLRVSMLAWVDDDGHYHAPTTVFAPVGEDTWGEPIVEEGDS